MARDVAVAAALACVISCGVIIALMCRKRNDRAAREAFIRYGGGFEQLAGLVQADIRRRIQQGDLPQDAARLLRENLWHLYDADGETRH